MNFREEVQQRLEDMVKDIQVDRKDVDGNPIPWDRYTMAQLLDLESLIHAKRPRSS